ncbi:MAG: thiamine-phosphate kinase, partial [Burkholderiaceae bacterium]
LLRVGAGQQLAVSTDMLVEGRHFFAGVDPQSLGHKALAVNLSDLAACGAQPLAFTLALALPAADAGWLEAFSRGLFTLAETHGCELVGGDTTRGPLTICVTVFGEVPTMGGESQALLRSGARDGDDIYVSGHLGDAHLALEALQGTITLPAATLAQARQRLEMPTPRVALGLALRGIATAAIDVSDGLLGDLGHILEASRLGATVDSAAVRRLLAADLQGMAPAATPDTVFEWVLAGGDDYELVFTAPPAAREAVARASRASNTPVAQIGCMQAQPGLRLLDGQGQPVTRRFHAFDHFA